ncbi:hypothetical protein D9M71_681040 [compost metagenome]
MKGVEGGDREPKAFPAGCAYEFAVPETAMGITPLRIVALGNLLGLHDLLDPHVLAGSIGKQVQGYGDI